MAVSKRTRFEVLRRDNHQCRYCGASAPDVPLVVDHVVPVALGGSDDPANLVAACRDCNSGKSSTMPDAPIVAQANASALAWAQAMQQAADERAAVYAHDRLVATDFRNLWKGWTWTDYRGNEQTFDLPADFDKSVRQFLAAGLTFTDFEELIRVAMGSTADKWKYFCGCCWRRIREAQARALEIVSDQPAPAADLFATAEALEQELAELRAERRRARMNGAGGNHGA